MVQFQNVKLPLLVKTHIYGDLFKGHFKLYTLEKIV